MKKITLFLKTAFLILLLWYLFKDIDFLVLFNSFLNFDIRYLVFVFLFYLLMYHAHAKKIIFLSRKKISYMPSLGSSIVGNGMNGILPAKLGEFAKVFYLKAAYGINSSVSFPVVFMDKFLDVNMFLNLLFLATTFSIHKLTIYPVFFAVVFVWVVLFFVAKYHKKTLRLIYLIKHQKIRAFFVDNLKNVIRNLTFRLLFIGMWYTILVWASFALITIIFLIFVAGLEITLYQAFVVFIFSVIGLAIPSTPAGVGLYEASMMLALGWYGVSKEEALSIAIALHFILFIPPIVVTMIIFSSKKISLSQIISASKKEKE